MEVNIKREDIEKLSKDSLKSLLDAKGIKYSDSWKKETFVDLVEQYYSEENSEIIPIQNNEIQNTNNENVNKIDGVGNAGAILNIVFASIGLFFYIPLSFMIIGIPFAVGAICTIVSNVRFRKGKNNKIAAGVLGLFFSGIIGGILVLVSKNTH